MFEARADAGRDALEAGRAADAVAHLRAAEALWRGPAFAEHLDAEWARGPATRLEERRLAVIEQRLQAELATGRFAEVAADASEAVREQPLREGLWALLATALYRAGRQGEALRALDEARRTLVEELGVEPGRHLRELESAILAHDPGLELRPAATPPPTARQPATRPAPLEGPPAIGRKSELAVLSASLAEAALAARFVVVEGDPGIGKTRLLDALAAEAGGRGALVLWGRTHESGRTPAYWPWLGALHALVESHPAVAPGLEPLLSPSPEWGFTDEPGPASFRLHEAVAVALEAVAAAAAPVLVLLDDLQWADPASLELLAFLTTRLVDAPVLVVAAMRTLELGRPDGLTGALASVARRSHSRRLTLHALDRDDSRELVAAAAGRDVDVAVAQAIHDRSGGNPFFTVQLARLLADEELLGDAAAVARVAVPAGVRDVLRRRLDQLPDATLELLRLAAVLGPDLDLLVLATTADRTLDDCLDAIEPAVVQRLLVEAPAVPATLAFAHGLVREVLVEDMTNLRRARLHLRAADALEPRGDDVAEIVAEHLWAARPLGIGERAADALERAAAVAVRRAALASAEEHLRRALDLRRTATSTRPEAAGAELATVLTLLEVVRSLHGYAAALPLVERGQELAEQLGDRRVLTHLAWEEWGAADAACDVARADALAERFRQRAEGAGPDEVTTKVIGEAVWGMHCWTRGRVGDAAHHLDASRRAAEQLRAERGGQGSSNRRRLIEAFALHVHDVAGDLDEPPAYDAVLGPEADRFARAMVAAFEACAAAAVGDLERAGRVSRAGLAADPDVSFSFWGSQNQMWAACAALADADGDAEVDAALALFEEGRARYQRAGAHTDLGLLHATVAIGLARAQRPDPAHVHLRRAQHAVATNGEAWPEPVVLLAEAELAASEGAPHDRVHALLEKAEAMATSQGSRAVARRVAAAASRLAPA